MSDATQATEVSGADDGTRASSPWRGWRLARDLVVIVLVGLLLSWGVRSCLLRTFSIPSGSMQQTLMIGDRIVVNELAPGLMPLHRGDVVVFVDPGGWLGRGELAGQDLVKRVIGLPGDHVTCCDADGRLLVDGEPVDEPYVVHADGGTAASKTDFDVTVPDGALWVMGDNRDRSSDSRSHQSGDYAGFVPLDHVVGRAFVVAWPIDRWRWLD